MNLHNDDNEMVYCTNKQVRSASDRIWCNKHLRHTTTETADLVVLLPRRLSFFKAIVESQTHNLWIRDFARSYYKMYCNLCVRERFF